jgi:tetratricopeptide (TPR) repeat protein
MKKLFFTALFLTASFLQSPNNPAQAKVVSDYQARHPLTSTPVAENVVNIASFQHQIALLQNDSSLANSYVSMSKMSWKEGQLSAAIEYANKAISLEPKNADALFWRGFSYRDLKQYDLAIADFDRTIALNNKYTSAYYARGLIYGKQNKYDMAIADMEIAAKLLKELGDDASVAQAEEMIQVYRINKNMRNRFRR